MAASLGFSHVGCLIRGRSRYRDTDIGAFARRGSAPCQKREEAVYRM
jgi:hypothetical protein